VRRFLPFLVLNPEPNLEQEFMHHEGILVGIDETLHRLPVFECSNVHIVRLQEWGAGAPG